MGLMYLNVIFLKLSILIFDLNKDFDIYHSYRGIIFMRRIKRLTPFNRVNLYDLSTKAQEHPLVAPHVSHFSQVPLRTMVKFWHSEHMLPV